MGTATKDKDERLALRFSTMLLLFFSFEAYLNHLGERIAPDIWVDERNNFNGRNEIAGRRYLGSIGKCEYLQSRCGVPEATVTNEMGAMMELKQFRDLLAHGKTEEGTTSYSCPQDESLELHTPEVWQLVNSDLMERAFAANKSLMTTIHSAALVAYPESGLEPSPFLSSFIQITDVTD